MICESCGKEISTTRFCYNCHIAYNVGKKEGRIELYNEFRKLCGLK